LGGIPYIGLIYEESSCFLLFSCDDELEDELDDVVSLKLTSNIILLKTKNNK